MSGLIVFGGLVALVLVLFLAGIFLEEMARADDKDRER